MKKTDSLLIWAGDAIRCSYEKRPKLVAAFISAVQPWAAHALGFDQNSYTFHIPTFVYLFCIEKTSDSFVLSVPSNYSACTLRRPIKSHFTLLLNFFPIYLRPYISDKDSKKPYPLYSFIYFSCDKYKTQIAHHIT